MEESTLTFLLLWQGGGVRIDGGEVTFTNCNIYKNTARRVTALALPGHFLHRPHGGKYLHMLVAGCRR